jgi:hypothetical protein
VLTLAELLSQKYPVYGAKDHCSGFYPLAVCSTLEKRFNGCLEQDAGYSPALPCILSIADQYEGELTGVFEAFGSQRSALEGQFDLCVSLTWSYNPFVH